MILKVQGHELVMGPYFFENEIEHWTVTNIVWPELIHLNLDDMRFPQDGATRSCVLTACDPKTITEHKADAFLAGINPQRCQSKFKFVLLSDFKT